MGERNEHLIRSCPAIDKRLIGLISATISVFRCWLLNNVVVRFRPCKAFLYKACPGIFIICCLDFESIEFDALFQLFMNSSNAANCFFF